jgi:hypothetical protein
MRNNRANLIVKIIYAPLFKGKAFTLFKAGLPIKKCPNQE